MAAACAPGSADCACPSPSEAASSLARVETRSETQTDLTADEGRLRVARNFRRAGLLIVFAFIAAGLAGLFDTREGRGSATGGDVELKVSYPERARAGLDSTLELTITRPGGFDEPIPVAIDAEWLSIFQVGGVQPQPDSETATPESAIWEFEPPPGDTLEVSIDLALRPALRGGKPGRVAVLGADDSELAAFAWETGVSP